MPPASLLKLTSFFLSHHHKPYHKFLTNNLSSSTVNHPKIPHPNCLPGRIAPCAPAAHVSITSRFRHNLLFHTSDCRRSGDPDRDRMGAAAVNGGVDESEKQKHGGKQPNKLLTLPTILTIGRVAAVPVLISTFYVESWWGPPATVGIFVTAATTDWLDGYLARKMKLGSQFGAFLDPVADKLMVAATLILLCTKPFEAGMFGQAPWLLTVPAIVIIGREITMSAVREWAASQDKKLLEAVAVNNLGKWKTATQMSALTILLAARDGSLVGAGTLVSSGVVLLYVSAWLSLWSLVVYMRKIWKKLLLH